MLPSPPVARGVGGAGQVKVTAVPAASTTAVASASMYMQAVTPPSATLFSHTRST